MILIFAGIGKIGHHSNLLDQILKGLCRPNEHIINNIDTFEKFVQLIPLDPDHVIEHIMPLLELIGSLKYGNFLGARGLDILIEEIEFLVYLF